MNQPADATQTAPQTKAPIGSLRTRLQVVDRFARQRLRVQGAGEGQRGDAGKEG